MNNKTPENTTYSQWVMQKPWSSPQVITNYSKVPSSRQE